MSEETFLTFEDEIKSLKKENKRLKEENEELQKENEELQEQLDLYIAVQQRRYYEYNTKNHELYKETNNKNKRQKEV